jgi:hypothetical protein
MVGPRVSFLNCRHHKCSSALHIFLTCARMLHFPSCASEPTICSPSILHGSFPKVQSIPETQATLSVGGQSPTAPWDWIPYVPGQAWRWESPGPVLLPSPAHTLCSLDKSWGIHVPSPPTHLLHEGRCPIVDICTISMLNAQSCHLWEMPARQPERVEKQSKVVDWLELVVQFLNSN